MSDDDENHEADQSEGTRGARVVLAWADGKGDEDDGAYAFRLTIKGLRDLQEACDAGPLTIARRLASGDWKVDDIRETIRLGLIGGGMDKPRARLMCERHVDDFDQSSLIENCLTAQAIIFAAVRGSPREPVGKKAKAGETTTTAGSTSPPSTDQPPARSAGPLEQSTT